MKKWQKWLHSFAACAMSVVVFAGCSASSGSSSSSSSTPEEVDDGIYTVTFDLCTDLKTNKILDQEVEKGGTVTKPVVGVIGDNPNNSEVIGWYEDPEYTDKWNFLTDTVEKDMTLYAQWTDKYTVTYYLGDETKVPMYSELIKAGETILKDRQSLSDGYRSEGFFLDPDHTQKFDFEQPITGNLNLYIDRSEEFYFSAKMLSERFVPVAAGAGANGAEAGSLTYVADENLADGDDSYTEINFGYVPNETTPDPHMNLSGVKVDITSSQKIKIRMKNMGPSETLRIYYVVRYADDSPVHAQFYNEKCAYTYNFKENERNMTAEDDWLEITLDLAAGTKDNSNIVNGVSLWGNAAYLNQLRFQSTCKSPDKENLNNVFWVQSIEGIKDLTHVNTADTPEIDNMLQSDDAAAVQQAADAQANIMGWVFPKNNDSVSGSVDFYGKTNGLLMYAPYRTKDAKIILTPEKDEPISLDNWTTLKIRLRNYGYATNFKLKYFNDKGRSNEIDVTINTRDTGVQEYELNMFGAKNWTGNLKSFELTYDSVGNDNAILFDSIEFEEYASIQIPGFNFNDRDTFGATTTAAMEVSYDSTNKGTAVNVIDAANAVIERAYTGRYTNVGYEKLTLNYVMPEAGITAVKVALTVDGEENVYEFPVTAEAVDPVSVDLVKTGNVENIKVTFVGTGAITIQSITFGLSAYAMDFSTNALLGYSDWNQGCAFDVNTTSCLMRQSSGTASIKTYFGILKKDKKVGMGNIPLDGKSKIVIVYQNTGDALSVNLAFGIVDKSAEDWETKHSEMYTPGGGAQDKMLEGNMAETEWTYAEFSLFTGSHNQGVLTADNVSEKAISVILLQFTNPALKASFKIRAIAVI